MWGGGGIEIGKNVLIAAHAIVTSQTHDSRAEIYKNSLVNKKIIINDNVWIGAGAIIFPGVELGENSIIGAGAAVIENVDAGDVVVGVPARSIKNIK